MPKKAPDLREVAEIVGVQALSFIAQEPERLGRFLGETGLGPQTLRTAAQEPAFLLAVLDFVLRDPALAEAFSAASEHHLTTIMAARQALDDKPWERDVP